MIWLDIKVIESKISNGELTEKDGFNYLFAFLILSAICLTLFTNNEHGVYKLLDCILTTVITIWGIKATYKANNDIDGKDFLNRFLAISWVIGMRLIIVALIIGLIVGIIAAIASKNTSNNLSDNKSVIEVFTLIFISMFQIICYLLIINSFRNLKIKTE